MLKRYLTIAMSGVLGLGLMAGAAPAQDTTAPPPPAKKRAPVARQRQKNQQKRIGEGVENGQLTPRETAKLEREQAQINREIRRDKKTGGGLTPRERAKIQRDQNKASRDIYREKHDAQTAPPATK